MKTKICTICKRELPLTSYNRCSRNKNGLKELCKECSRKKSKIYRQNNVEKEKARHAEYRKRIEIIYLKNQKNIMIVIENKNTHIDWFIKEKLQDHTAKGGKITGLRIIRTQRRKDSKIG